MILHTESLSTAFVYFDTFSTVTYVTGHSSCAVVMSVERKLSVAYSATVCGEMRLYYGDITTLSMLSVIHIQASSFSFTCLSRKPTETIKEDPRDTHRWLCRFRVQSIYFVLWEPTRWKQRSDAIAPWECDDLHQESCNFRTLSVRMVYSCTSLYDHITRTLAQLFSSV